MHCRRCILRLDHRYRIWTYFENVSTVVVGGSDYDEISIVVMGTQTSVNNFAFEVSETITINSNPEVNLANTNIPGSICVGSTVNVSSSLLPGTGSGSGQQMTYSWTNSDDPAVFDIQLVQGGSAAVIAVSDIQNIPTKVISPSTSQTPTVTAQETFTIDIVELPVFGDLTAVTQLQLLGTSFNLGLSEVSVDNGLDAADLVLTWEANMNSQLEEPTIVTDGTSATITPFIAEVAFQDFVAPEPLNVSVTADIGGCSNTANFNAVVGVSPSIERRTTTTCAWAKIGWQRSPDARSLLCMERTQPRHHMDHRRPCHWHRCGAAAVIHATANGANSADF